MTIKDALVWGVKHLREKKFHVSELDSEILLAHVLGKDRAFLFSHLDQKIGRQKMAKFKKTVQRRAKREPTAYIIGKKYFYGLLFNVNKQVLIPRPESEMLVDLGLKYLDKNKRKKITVMDIGTGSGAIVVALAKNFKGARALGTDNSSQALTIAKKNAQDNRAKIDLIKSDLLEKFSPNFWKRNSEILMLANLPYLPTEVWREAMPDVKKFEPRTALDGGKDGLDHYRRLVNQLELVLPFLKSFQAYWEIDPTQADAIKNILKKAKARKIKIYKDLCGHRRVVGWGK